MLTYALPLKSLYLTGKRSSAMTAVNAKEAEGLMLDGRGYRNNFYEKLSSDDIMRRLGSWSPIVRERAATEIARRKEAPIDALVKMLESPTLEFRYGACVTMAKLKEAAVPAVPALLTTLQHKDLWLRIEAARALNQIGAVSAVPELLKILAREPAKDDPRGMEQRYLLLDRILKKPIAGVDLQMLYAAIRAGLHNQDGRARSEIAPVYAYLKPQQIEPLLPDIYQAIIKLAPSGEMFADGIRLAGLDLLSRLHIREGMILCVSVIELDRWGQGKRLPKCLEYLVRYGVHAKEVLPQLREMRAQLAKSGKAKAPSDEVKLLDSTIAAIEASTASPKVVGLKDFTAHL